MQTLRAAHGNQLFSRRIQVSTWKDDVIETRTGGILVPTVKVSKSYSVEIALLNKLQIMDAVSQCHEPFHLTFQTRTDQSQVKLR